MLSQILKQNSGWNSFSTTDCKMMGLTSSILGSANALSAGTKFISSLSLGSSYQERIGIPFSG
jgi:hypothetical protein